jgi:peptide/nickel transport system ATP-binding protein
VTATMPAITPILDVSGLTLELPVDDLWHPVVDDVGFTVGRGETLGIVGESGSGKTMTSLTIMGLAPRHARRPAGRALLDGVDLLTLDERALQRVRGREVGMIFQEPRRSLNPALTVGEQVAEVLRRHLGLGRRQAWGRAVELLDRVAIPTPAQRAHDHAHRFSGGMCQRVMLAMALACEPKLLIADEPTTALDVTVQAQVLDLIAELQRDLGLAVVFITHDLGVVAEICDSMVVLYAGQVVERGAATDVFAHPHHPYTAGLLASIPDPRVRTERLGSIGGTVPSAAGRPTGCRFHPRCPHVRDRCTTVDPPLVVPGTGTAPGSDATRCLRVAELALSGIPDLEPAPEDGIPLPTSGAGSVEPPTATVVDVHGLTKSFVLRRDLVGRPVDVVAAARGVDLALVPGRTLALVGESGAGKSTIGRMLLGLERADGGSIDVLGADPRTLRGAELLRWRGRATMIFQNPYNSFDPRMTVADAVAEPLVVHRRGGSRREQRALAAALLGSVGLTDRHGARYPHELSGGELQRAAIARALTTDPGLIVCDEPVAALDMSIRAEVVNLLRDLQAERGVSYLFISHDLALVRVIAHEVAVIRGGEIVERAPADELFAAPRHEYTRSLLAAVPVPDPRRRKDRGPTAAVQPVTPR